MHRETPQCEIRKVKGYETQREADDEDRDGNSDIAFQCCMKRFDNIDYI